MYYTLRTRIYNNKTEVKIILFKFEKLFISYMVKYFNSSFSKKFDFYQVLCLEFSHTNSLYLTKEKF